MNIQQRFHSRLAAYPVRKAVLFITGVVVALHLALSLFAWMLAQHEIVPALEQKAYATGLAEARRLTRKLASGVAFEQLQGVQEQFDGTLRRNPDLAYIILTDNAGRIVVRSGSGGEVFTPERYSAVTREIERKLVTYGQVHVGIDRQYIVAQMKAVRGDVIGVLLASLLAAAGLSAYATHQAFGQPVGQVALVLARLAAGDFRFRTAGTTAALDRAVAKVTSRVNEAHAALCATWPGPRDQAAPSRAQAAWDRLRANCQFADAQAQPPVMAAERAPPTLLCFLILLADAVSRPVLAHYAGDLAAFRAAVTPSLRAGLPVAALPLAAALALPMAQDWRVRAGAANALAAGCLLLLLGYGAAGLVDDSMTLTVGRALAGIGMALGLSAILGASPRSGERRSGSSTAAILATAALAAESIGAPIGGIIGKLAGMQAVSLAAALLAACCAVIGYRLLAGAAPVAVRPRHRGIASSLVRPGHWFPFTVLQLAAQLPAAAAAGAFTTVLLPLALRQAGYDYAQAGRYGLVLALLVLVTSPLARRLAFRSSRYALVGVLGAGLVGAGTGPLSTAAGAPQVAAALALLGAGLLLMCGTCLVLAQRAARAAEFRDGALATWPWSAPLACLCAAAGAIAAGAGCRAYGAAAAAAASGSLALMGGAGFMLAYLLVVVLPSPGGSGTIRPS